MTKAWIKFVHKAASEVPAYSHFLESHNFKIGNLKNLDDFRALPVMDKRNFISKFPLNQLYSRKKVPAMIYASSGSSGKPTFWLRDDEQEERGGEIHLKIFRDIFKINPSDSTLVIICFSTG